MKIAVFLSLTFLCGISCNMSPKEKPYFLLVKYSELKFKKENLTLVNFKDEISGMTKNEGIREALFKIHGLNNNSLRREILKLGYKSLPIKELVIADRSLLCIIARV